ncbi:MAG TPA: ABC transporter ATP-binding protein [Candidatus Hydrogenedentes bacterium]|nr:ABC transporter ATP-binding protein [Candidatus Hydrogenedentota bacterium]HQH54525.1 ABC transporter ATP-binding protein [Candidatus Hydrogenedentota bacterium]HQM48070.1 ABC transporter ATP-binding protein [Candidatus Hydrogenedentota bacterium]
MAIIELTDVEVSYGAVKALQGVTCAVQGGAVGLLGPNGAGKSTLLKTLLGFIRADAGEAALFGFKLPEQALEARQRLGYMPERDVVGRKVSAVSFLTYCGCLFGMKRTDAMERAHEVLNYVGVGESRYRKMQTYSTGMCQRIKFAQALVHDPKLLLLDEPTNGLDPEGRIEMLQLIKELVHKRGVTVLLSSHLLPDVEHVCDHVLVIHKGRIVREGSIGDLTTARENLFEIRVRENKEAFRQALEQAGCTLQTHPNGNLLVEKPAAMNPRLFFEIAQQKKTQVRHFVPVRHRLEEVFMQAIGRR